MEETESSVAIVTKATDAAGFMITRFYRSGSGGDEVLEEFCSQYLPGRLTVTNVEQA